MAQRNPEDVIGSQHKGNCATEWCSVWFVAVDHPMQSSSRAVELNFDSSAEATEIESREREAGGMFILKPIRQT
ncbi:hypothetical protein ACLKA7_006428 [Drosophila subpalustris]